MTDKIPEDSTAEARDGGAGRSCLIVDGSRVIRLVAGKILESLGFTVVEAEDAEAGLAAVEERMPDAVLVDWDLGSMSGVAFMKAVRESAGEAAAPRVLFCSGQTGVERIREAVEAGADEYIMKPFDSEIIESKLAQAGLL